MEKIAPVRPANPARATEVGEVLATDQSYHIAPHGEKLLVCNLIDEASKFHVARIVKRAHVPRFADVGNIDEHDLIDCVTEWARCPRVPKVIYCDDEGVFSSEKLKQWCLDSTAQRN